MKTLIGLVLLFSSSAWGMDQDWLCRRQASEVYDDKIEACGAAIGRTEGEARRVSLAAALAEFRDLCSISEHCKNRKFDAYPERTECLTTAKGYKCYRMIKIVLLPMEEK